MATIGRKVFFDGIRSGPFPGTLTAPQVGGITSILNEWERRGLTDLRWLAYMLATVYWETAHTMQPVREMGGEAYLKSKKYYPWVGEGLVQVTWEANHRKFGATEPGQLLTWPIALRALFDGMTKGMFTGKKLSDYFNATTTDWVNARRIINGTDRAGEIATIAKQFYSDLTAAEKGPAPVPVPVPTPAPIPAPVPVPPGPRAPGKDIGTTAGGVVAGGAAVGVNAGWGLAEWIIFFAFVAAAAVAGYFILAWWRHRNEQKAEAAAILAPVVSPDRASEAGTAAVAQALSTNELRAEEEGTDAIEAFKQAHASPRYELTGAADVAPNSPEALKKLFGGQAGLNPNAFVAIGPVMSPERPTRVRRTKTATKTKGRPRASTGSRKAPKKAAKKRA